MYKTIRILRIIIAFVAMLVPTWALIAGYESVFVRMQIFTALLSGVGLVLLFWAIVTLVYGRIYCSTVCPLGTLMDCVGVAYRLVGRKRKNFRYCRPASNARMIFLVISLLTLIVGGGIIPTLFDPGSAYSCMVEEFVARPLGRAWDAVAFSLSTLAAAIATAVGILAVAPKHGRLICNTVCPVGTILGIGARRSYFQMEIDPDRCINCGECERVCKAQCIKLTDKIIDTSRCVVCFDCTAVCPNSSINYKSGKHRLQTPLMEPSK